MRKALAYILGSKLQRLWTMKVTTNANMLFKTIEQYASKLAITELYEILGVFNTYYLAFW